MASESAPASQTWTVTIEIPGEAPHTVQVEMSATDSDSWEGSFVESGSSEPHPDPIKGTLRASRLAPGERTKGGVTF